MSTARERAGVPTGGRFAPTSRAEAPDPLAPDRAQQCLSAAEVEILASRIECTFRGDQQAYELAEDLRSLSRNYLPRMGRS
ncbi:MAG: hypothetical protein WKF57_06170 [Nakamurella sp.]